MPPKMMTDMKKIVLTLLMLATALQAGAVLKENIYSVLNENGIEIPFPQADVHIRIAAPLPDTI